MTKYNSYFKQQVIEFYLQNGKSHSLTHIHYYNHEHIQIKLKGLSPVNDKTQSLN